MNIYRIREMIKQYSKQIELHAMFYCNCKNERRGTKRQKNVILRRIASLRECLDLLEQALEEDQPS